MVVTYLAQFNYQFIYHHRPGYRINLQLVLNTAYSCPSNIDYMHWSLKQSILQSYEGVVIKFVFTVKIQYQHRKMQDCVYKFLNGAAPRSVSECYNSSFAEILASRCRLCLPDCCITAIYILLIDVNSSDIFTSAIKRVNWIDLNCIERFELSKLLIIGWEFWDDSDEAECLRFGGLSLTLRAL